MQNDRSIWSINLSKLNSDYLDECESFSSELEFSEPISESFRETIASRISGEERESLSESSGVTSGGCFNCFNFHLSRLFHLIF